MTTAETADFLVIGAGIAGASVAYWLAPHGRVVVLEAESQPGFHSTGRSAALYMASYGGPQVRALSLASRAFFDTPPEGFAEHPLLSPRGALMVAGDEQVPSLEAHLAVLRDLNPRARRLDAHEACALVPALRRERIAAGLLEDDAADMDVHAIHQGFLRGVRRGGGVLACDARIDALRRVGGVWQAQAGGRRWQAPVVVNAAGAWADEVGRLAGVRTLGLQPKRRSAMIFAPPEGLDAAAWPMVYGATENWYIKPDAGMMLGSPANADPVAPHDVQPEELDIATAIYNIEEMTTLRIRRPTRTWAGLRSFVPDGSLVGGFAPDAPGFFWLCGQGGYGIQTSPAMGEACAALARGADLPAHIAGFGLTPALLGPTRPGLGTATPAL